MKIAYLVPDSAISGGHRVLFQQAEGLGKTGLSVTLVSPAAPPDWFPLSRSRWERGDFYRSAAIPEADVVLATFWTTAAPAVAAARGPVFHLCQGYEADFSFYAYQHDAIRAAYALPTRKLAVSPHVARRLEEEGYAPVDMIGQVFDADEFPPPPDRPFDRLVPTILLVGTFEADIKGIREALDALQSARAAGVVFRLVRVSATPPAAGELALGIADEHRVQVPPAEMSALYRSSDLLIGPSQPQEGFDLPVLEALSSGLPALLSDTPAHRNSARDAAAYFTAGSAPSLRSALGPLLADAGRRSRLSSEGCLEAGRFRTADVVERLIECFENALAARER